MLRKPDAEALLEATRALLLDDLLAEVPEEQRYLVRLAARAVAIAAREMRRSDADLEREAELLAGLYGEEAVRAAGDTPAARVAAMNRRLARDIRAGVLDGACALGVRALLREQVQARVRISNPGYLERARS